MKERPILFNGAMVRAILSGQKTQTRRIMREQVCAPGIVQIARTGYCEIVTEHGVHIPGFHCPYGQSGDRLYVRETFAQPTTLDPGLTIYRADYPDCVPPEYINVPPADEVVWRPSIHMPKALSRITLEITGLRVERLQGISEADARAEGITDGGCTACGNPEPCGCDHPTPSALDSFVRLWQSTGGGWDANPWVWVVEFRRIET